MKIPQMFPFIGMDEYDSMKECFETNWLTEGPKSKQFVSELCSLVGSKYGVLAPNGTLALYLGLRSLGIGEGDEVIVPNFTFIASATAVSMAGAKPVFVDIEPESLQIDVQACERVLSSATKAIMPVHIYGASCDMTQVMKFANDNNLMVIEDAAQAIGVHWDSKHCGSFGDVGCFSFFADKTITTVEGGFVCTDNEETYKSLLSLRNQGRINRGTFIHPEIGYNFRMNDLQSAIGLKQLEKRDFIFKRKLENFNLYYERLKNNKNLRVILPKEKSGFVPFRVAVVFNERSDEVAKFLASNGVETRTFFYPLHKQPCYDDGQDKDENFSSSIELFNHGLCFPVYPDLTREEISYICDKIDQFYEISR
tara:strand:- start:2365 stop:3465 length:1101 start_codon:yes stop_codon:yes gene_type:complete